MKPEYKFPDRVDFHPDQITRLLQEAGAPEADASALILAAQKTGLSVHEAVKSRKETIILAFSEAIGQNVVDIEVPN